jgi:stearoyl-CoA desaturase (delta-9 desaturase)
VNSASHTWGYRNYHTRDTSTNLWWVGLLGHGEGWHNNHHAFQSSANFGHRWWELDLSYWVIKGLGLVGIAYDIKSPKIDLAERRAMLAEQTEKDGTPSRTVEPEMEPVESAAS